MSFNRLQDAIIDGDINFFDTFLDKDEKIEDLSPLVLAINIYCSTDGSSAGVAEHFIRQLAKFGSPKDFEILFFRYFNKPQYVDAYWNLPHGYEKKIHWRLMRVLLDIGINKDLVTSTLCEYITRNGLDFDLNYIDNEYIQYFIELGADLNKTVELDTDSPRNVMATVMGLTREADELVYPLLKVLIQNGGDPRMAVECYGSQGGYLYRMLEHGIDVELKPNNIGLDGETDVTRELTDLCFEIVSIEEIIASLKRLKEAGADFNTPNVEGNYPINKAIKNILDDSYQESLHESESSLSIIQFLLDSGINLAVENSDEQTALMQAIPNLKGSNDTKNLINCSKRIMSLLIDNGAAVFQKSSNGQTVFDITAKCPAINKWLMKYNKDISQ